MGKAGHRFTKSMFFCLSPNLFIETRLCRRGEHMTKAYSHRDENGNVVRKICVDCEATLMKGNYAAKGRCHRCYGRHVKAKLSPEEKRIKRINGLAKEAGIPGVLVVEEWLKMMEDQHGVCPRCKLEIDYFTVDHIVPLSRGGTNTMENVQPLCMECNSSKWNRDEAPSFSYQKALPMSQ